MRYVEIAYLYIFNIKMSKMNYAEIMRDEQ